MGITRNTFLRIHSLLQTQEINIGKVLEIGAQQLIGDFQSNKIRKIIQKYNLQNKFNFSKDKYSKELYEPVISRCQTAYKSMR